MTSPSGRSGSVVVAGVIALILGGGAILGFEILTSRKTEACGAPFAERIDPLTSQHLLPGGPEPAFSSNPPTSGAHKPGVHPTGVLTKPIERAVQVALLEDGEILIQYRDISASALASLRALARTQPHVTVAPNATIDKKIVATAWLYKLQCARLSETDLQSFIDDHPQKAAAQ